MGTGRGEVELEGKVLVLKRIAVTYSGLTLDDEQRRTAERVLGFHADACPVDRSIRGAIDVITSLA